MPVTPWFKKNKKFKNFRLGNKAYRDILQVPIYTASEFLKGEIGAPSSESKDIKNKWLLKILKIN